MMTLGNIVAIIKSTFYYFDFKHAWGMIGVTRCDYSNNQRRCRFADAIKWTGYHEFNCMASEKTQNKCPCYMEVQEAWGKAVDDLTKGSWIICDGDSGGCNHA